MKVSELIEKLKGFPQEMEVFKGSNDSDYDYMPLYDEDIHIENSVPYDEDLEDEPQPVNICVVGAP